MRHSSTSGFTLVELIVVMIVATILVGLLFGPLDDLYVSNQKGVVATTQMADTRSALRYVSNDVVNADAFYTTNTTDVAGPTNNAPSVEWNSGSYTYAGSGTNNRILILSQQATSIAAGADNVSAPARQLLLASDCQTPVENTFIYFLSGTTLYRRTIPGASTAACAWEGSLNNAYKQSCPATYRPAGCMVNDAKVLPNVTQFSVDYYTPPITSASTPIVYAAGTDLSTATSIRITIQTTIGAGTNATTSTGSMIMTRTNGANS